VPHAIAWRGHNPHQALPEHLVQSYPSLNAHPVGYSSFWENGIPEHLQNLRVGKVSGSEEIGMRKFGNFSVNNSNFGEAETCNPVRREGV